MQKQAGKGAAIFTSRNDLWEISSHSPFVLKKYFWTGKNIVVLEYILLNWNAFFWPGVHVVVL